MEAVSNWWKARTFAQLSVPEWMKELLSNMQPILLALQEKIQGLNTAAASRRRRSWSATRLWRFE
jgi:hypothetical protein